MTAAEPLYDALQSFLLADSWEATRAVVAAEPDLLLGDEAQHLLRTLADRARGAGDESAAVMLEEHLRLLQVSRADSIDDAFDGLATRRDEELGLEHILAELADPPSGRADLARRIELCEIALTQVSRDSEPELWALVAASLGTALMMSPVGDRARQLESAIAALASAVEELERCGQLHEAARALNNLGLTFEARLSGAPDENLEYAIGAYERALAAVGSSADVAHERAETLNNLANALNRRQRGRRDDNRERAIVHYEEALGLLGDEPTQVRVRTQVNLGVVLIERFRGSRVANLDRAIEAFAAALVAVDPRTAPADWAHIQANLGNALQRRSNAAGDDEDLERAIVSYEAALEVYRDVGATSNRALTLSNLGNALLARSAGDRAHNIERAIDCYSEALEILDRDRHPFDWAQAQNNLGQAYRARPTGVREENLEQAIAAYEAAAATLSSRNAPVEYAQVQKNLGTSYRDRVQGNRADNLARAIDAYSEALNIRVQVYGPDHPRVASVLYSMAKAQRRAGEFETARGSLERAIAIDEAGEAGVSERLGRRYRSLAHIARELGDLEGAERALRRALSIAEELHGAEHPDVYADLRALALVRRARGHRGMAIDTLERAIAIEELTPWGAPDGVRGALLELAELLREGGELAAAERTLRRAVSIDEAVYGPDHPRVSELLIRLGEILSESNQPDAAHEAARRAAAILNGPRGGAHPGLAAAIEQLTARAGQQTPTRADPVKDHAPPQTQPVAARVSFRERLDGYVAFDTADSLAGGAGGGEPPSASPLQLRLHILVADVAAFLSEPCRPGTVGGFMCSPEVGDELPLERGSYAIAFDENSTGRRTISYDLTTHAADGKKWLLRGERTVDADADADQLAATSTLRVTLSAQDGTHASGVVTVRHLDFIEQLGSIRVDAPTPTARKAALDSFASAVLGPVWEFHARDATDDASGFPERDA